ncbi:MAG: NAD(P)-binding domain-containing protein, partial [Desulfobacterales bacterium]|nr:NAD(P)-binding domain-containing protein [Desulfobacterales bacterium]
DIIIDAGNANFRDTMRHFSELEGSGIEFLGVGVSGGEEGARHGPSIMVGGNIKGYSRVLTTATVRETGRGNFDVAIALSIILMLLAFCINAILTQIQQRERPR